MSVPLRAPWALVAAVTLVACSSTQESPPAPFLFGTSVAGFQVDMGCPTLPAAECEDPASDWHQLVTSDVPSLRALLTGGPPSTGPGHYELYDSDFALAKASLGTGALRLSLEWSRVFPAATDGATDDEALRALADPRALAHYHAVFASLRAHGMKPLVTLNHYTLPTWLHDGEACHQDLDACADKGWFDRERAVREAAKYAGFVAREFGGEVDLWATLNEPLAVVVPGYLMPSAERVNPPAVFLRFDAAKTVMRALIEAHARMYDAVKAQDLQDADGDGKPSEVGLVYAFTPTRPRDASDPLDVQGAEDVFYLWNLAFLNAVARGDFDENLDGRAVRRADLAGRMDWLGVNYYTRVTVTGSAEPVLPELSVRTRFDPFSLGIWEDYPRGLYEMLKLANAYGVPAIVTENGAADPSDDGTGSSYLVRHFTWLERARAEGADVRGYFWWTLMDNYEWQKGMGVRMGLFAVDPEDPAKTRRPRRTVATYAELIRAGTVTPELAERYPAPE